IILFLLICSTDLVHANYGLVAEILTQRAQFWLSSNLIQRVSVTNCAREISQCIVAFACDFVHSGCVEENISVGVRSGDHLPASKSGLLNVPRLGIIRP